MAQKPEITKEEYLEAIERGVYKAIRELITERDISFFTAIEEGVRQATEKANDSKTANAN